MLQVFYLDNAYACNDFSSVFKRFASVLNVCCKYFSCFRRMLQLFHLNVAKLDLVLHIFQLFQTDEQAGQQASRKRPGDRASRPTRQSSKQMARRANASSGRASRREQWPGEQTARWAT
jgi:hypothetical protein